MITEFYIFGYETVQTCDGFKCGIKWEKIIMNQIQCLIRMYRDLMCDT